MANDVSYFNLENDSTEYAFNDADAEIKISQETARATAAEEANAAAISAETSRAQSVEGTLSSLTTAAKSNLVAAINEVDAGVDTLNSKFANNFNGFKVYTSLSQLGLTSTATTIDIYNAMPNLSMALLNIESSDGLASELGYTSGGSLYFYRINAWRVMGQAISYNGRAFKVCIMRSVSGVRTPTWSDGISFTVS